MERTVSGDSLISFLCGSIELILFLDSDTNSLNFIIIHSTNILLNHYYMHSSTCSCHCAGQNEVNNLISVLEELKLSMGEEDID